MVAKHARTQDAVVLTASARLDSHAVGVTHATRRLAAVQTTPDMQSRHGGEAIQGATRRFRQANYLQHYRRPPYLLTHWSRLTRRESPWVQTQTHERSNGATTKTTSCLVARRCTACHCMHEAPTAHAQSGTPICDAMRCPLEDGINSI